jgi:hypothetical protein
MIMWGALFEDKKPKGVYCWSEYINGGSKNGN